MEKHGKLITFATTEKAYLLKSFKKVSQSKLARKFSCSATAIRNFYVNQGLIKLKVGKGLNKNKLTDCLCPKCSEQHARVLSNWVGKVPARKFCVRCLNFIESKNY